MESARLHPPTAVKRVLPALAIVVVAACGVQGNVAAPADPDGGEYVIRLLTGRNETAARIAPWHRTIDEVLPNVTYRRADGSELTLSDVAGVGRIVAVEKGRGFTVQGEDAPSGTPVDFDHPEARWRSIHFTFRIEEPIGTADAPDSVQVAMISTPDFERMKASLLSLGRLVLFAKAGSPLVEYDPSLYVVPQDTELLVTVGDDGTLDLPVLRRHPDTVRRLLAATPRLDDLSARGRAPRTTVQLTRSGAGDERP